MTIETRQIAQQTTSVVQQYPVSFDNRYMLTGFVSASLIPGTPFVNMWGNVTVDSLLVTDKNGVVSRIDRRLQSLNQDNISVAYDQDTLDSVLALLRICRWPNIEHYRAFLDDANTFFPCTVTSLETNQWVSQPLEIDLDHTIFTTQYALWNVEKLDYAGYDFPQNGEVWSGGLVLGSSGAAINIGSYVTHDVQFGTDATSPTYIEKLTVNLPVAGYKYLRAVGYKTPFVRADMPYTLEWLSDNTSIITTELYCRDLCCSGCDGAYYGSFPSSGSVEVDGHPKGTQRLWLIKGKNATGAVISQMWFSAVATCPRKLTYFGEFIEDCKLPPSPPPPPPPPSPTPLPPPPSPSTSPSASPSPSRSSWQSSSPSPSPSPSLLSPSTSVSPSPSLSRSRLPLSQSLSPSPSTSRSPLASPSMSMSPSVSPSLLSPSPSPSPSLLSPSHSPSISLSPSRSLSPSTSPSPSIEVSHAYGIPRVSDSVDGKFVIVWENQDNASSPVVMAQVFGPNNVAITSPFVVPSYDDKTSHTPDVAMAPDGTFMVVWQGPDIDFATGIQCRSYDANGNPIYNPVTGDNGQFRINDLADAAYYKPAIGMRSDKSFVVVWAEYFRISTNNPGRRIFGSRRYAGGNPMSGQFQVSPNTTATGNYKTNPAVDVADNGDFTVVWDDDRTVDGTAYQVYGIRFNAAQNVITGEFRVCNQGSRLGWDGLMSPRISVAPGGSFVVVWHRYPNFIGPDYITPRPEGGVSVVAKRYNAAGVAQGGEFVVNQGFLNSYTTPRGESGYLYNAYPDVACDKDGNFIVVWETTWSSLDKRDDPITQDGALWGREYNAAGVAITNEFCLNNYNLAHRAIGNQAYPAVTREAGSGQWVSAWQGPQGIAPSGGPGGIWRLQVTDPGDVRRQPIPSIYWVLNAPLSGNYLQGSNITISWFASGIQPGYTVCLCVTPGADFTNAIWISIGSITATNGWANWVWNGRDTSGNLVPKGTYYIAGYIWNGSAATYAHATTTFIIS